MNLVTLSLKKVLRDTLVIVGVMVSISAVAFIVVYLNTLHDKSIELVKKSETEIYAEGDTIFINGQIDQNASYKFNRVMVDALSKRDIKKVQIDSIGGSAYVAMDIAQSIQGLQLDTVAFNKCHSACTIIFLGGSERTVGLKTTMGFHSPGWEVDESKNYDSAYVRSYVAVALEFSGQLMKWYIDRGLSVEFSTSVLSVPFEDAKYLVGTELLKEGVATELAMQSK